MLAASYQDLFREVFKDAEPGYVPIVLSNLDTGQFPSDILWYETRDFAEDLELPLKKEGHHHVYFTPHSFLNPSSRLKENASPTGCCVWIESDDEHFNYNAVEEARPSAVVRTSPGRNHVYWFLDKPTDIRQIEAVNKSLTYKYLKHDRSGWDITQLLRVPDFENKKRDVPFDVEIVEFYPDRRYDLIKAFGRLPIVESPEPLGGARDAEFDTPDTDSLPDLDDVRRKWWAELPPSVHNVLAHRAPDRSKSLWFLYNECIRLDMPRLHTFVLAKSSPNNKFADSKYHGDRELWADVCAAYRLIEEKAEGYILEKLEAIRVDPKKRMEEKNREISKAVMEDMTLSGGFYYSPEQKKCFYEYRNKLINIDERTTDFRALIDCLYLINPASQEFKYVANHIKDHVIQDGLQVSVRNVSYYNEKDNILYISDNNGGMYRLDGEEIRRIDSGVDGIVFIHPHDAEPIEIHKASTYSGSPLDDFVLSKPNFDPDVLSKEDAMFLFRTWLYTMFFMDNSKAILVIEGGRGSGKSTGFKGAEWILHGPEGDVQELPGSAQLLREAVRNQHHVFFDNVDEPQPWLQTTLATIATGSKERKRVLYTDDDFAVHRLNAALGLSTKSASFLREDVVDRSIILSTKRFESFDSIDEIKTQVIAHRTEIWAEMLEELNAIVKRLPTWESQQSLLRMSNFAQFLFILCEIRDKNSRSIELFLQGEQDRTVLAGDAVWETLRLWLETEENYGRSLTSKHLHEEFIRLSNANDIEYIRAVASPKKLTWKLKDLEPNLHEIEMTIESGKRGLMYSFKRKERDANPG